MGILSIREGRVSTHLDFRCKTCHGLPVDLDLLRLVTDTELGAFPASTVQRALMLAADGKPDNMLLPPERMLFHFNCDSLPSIRPRLVIIRTGVRAAKSPIAALALLLCALTCKFRREPNLANGEIPAPDGLVGVRPGELVRALIVAPKLKLSRAPLEHIRGTMQASPILKRYIVKDLGESITIRRPDGAMVMIETVAAGAGGDNLRSTWLAGVLFDEAAFHDDDDGAVNLSDNLRAVKARMLDDGQIWVVSSPWSEDDPFNLLFTQLFGRPGRELAFHSDSRSMNPTLSMEDEQAERASDPEATVDKPLLPATTCHICGSPQPAAETHLPASGGCWACNPSGAGRWRP